MPARARTIAFVASCLNEEGNVGELYRRCLAAFEAFTSQHPRTGGWAFAMTLADNGSTDGTAAALLELRERDPRVQVLINARNYGPEPSVVHALERTEADVVVLLASDLQDPPEFAFPMLERLLAPDSRADAVLACKRSLPKGPLVQLGRMMYYQLLKFGSRSVQAPNGFHGFGVYRAEAIQDAIALWKQTAMSLRQAIARSCHAGQLFAYELAARSAGRSSYGIMTYTREGLAAVLSGDAITTRLTMRTGITALLGSLAVGGAIIANVMNGRSGYAAGTPTVMLLVLASLGIQALLISMLGYQIENLNLPIRRPVVRLNNHPQRSEEDLQGDKNLQE